jgi:phospholysine phosphohistidine inorganic pyrophosphate phosphatase
LFLTNTTSRPRSALVDKLAGMGIDTQASHILTPAVAAHEWIKNNVHGTVGTVGTVALFIPEATKTEFHDLPVAPLEQSEQTQSVGAVVVGDLGEQWDFPMLNQAFRLLMREPRPTLIALGMTRYWSAEDGLRLDAGPFVSALHYASGREPIVLGKPAKPFYHAALQRLGVNADQAYMIGDDIRGDVDGAQQAGIKALLVKTGKFQDGDLQLGITPLACLDSIVDLPLWWQDNIAGQ